MGAAVFSQIEHPADMAVGDPTGGLQLVPEPLNDLLVYRYLGLDEFEGDLLMDLGIFSTVDLAHPPPAELLDDLVAAGEKNPPGKIFDRRFHGLGECGLGISYRRQRGPALTTEFLGISIIQMTLRTFHWFAPLTSQE